MDANRFDRLTQTLSASGTRRLLLGVLGALPALGGLAALLDRDAADARKRGGRRQKRRGHGPHEREVSAAKKKRKHKKHKKHKKQCKPQPKTTTCAGTCGPVKNNCKQTVDCGSCACDPPCGDCQACDGSQCRSCEALGQICCNDTCVTGTCCTNADCSGTTPICDASNTCVACADHGECPANHLCLSNGTCQACTVFCNGTPAACGMNLQTGLDKEETVYVCPGTYQGNFAISTAIRVIGAGEGDDDASNTILDANGAGTVMQISEGTGPVELERLRITGARQNFDSEGGGIVHLGMTLLLRDCVVTGNDGKGPCGIFTGDSSTLEMTRCTVSANHAPGATVGGLFTQGTTTLTDCLIADNDGDIAGGIGSGGVTTLAGSTVVRGNTAAIGGGIYVVSGTLEIAETCRVTGNTASAGNGGGIFNDGGTVTLHGADPSQIVVDNCHENCVGEVPKCAPGGICPP